LDNRNSIKKVFWEDVRDEVKKVNPEFATAIDAVSPDKNLPLYVANYSYGMPYVKDGVFHVPNEQGEVVRIDDSSIASEVRIDLSYAINMPLSLLLDKTIEIYMESSQKFGVFKTRLPGRIFALWALLQPLNTASNSGGSAWQLISGERCLITLPKISQIGGFQRLKKEFNLKLNKPPKNLTEQNELFTALANSAKHTNDWYSKILFFTQPWFEKLQDLSWRSLKYYLLETAWLDTSDLRGANVVNFSFSQALDAKNLKPNPYLCDIVKHLYCIGNGEYPSFRLAVDESAAPIRLFQSMLIDVYGLDYAPIMFHQAHMSSVDNVHSLYYSLEWPCLMTFSPKSRKALNKLLDLREIKHILEATQEFFRADSLKLKGNPLYDMFTKTKFEFFHSKPDKFDEIQDSLLLSNIDPELQKELAKYPGKKFCRNSLFLSGCIRISLGCDKQ